MSRWWPETLRVGIGDELVEVTRGPAGAREHRVRHRAVFRDVAAPAQAWAAALDALDFALERCDAKGGSAGVVLSSRWVRYAVLPWHAQLQRRSAIEQHARAQFQRTFGPVAQAWDVRVSSARWGEARLACAVDRGLLDGIRARLAARRAKLAALRPLLMAAHNGARRRLGGHATLVLLEPTRLCLARTQASQWSEVIVRRVGGGDAWRALEQELATSAGTDPEPPLVVLLVGESVPWRASPSRPTRVVERWSVAGCAAM